MPRKHHDFIIREIVKEMRFQEWEQDPDNPDTEVRRVYLGSFINPSGKYYLPFACSNVAGDCPRCHGRGKTKPIHTCDRCGGAGVIITPDCHATRPNSQEQCYQCDGCGYVHRDCTWCGGCGSRSAYIDERFWESLEHDLEKVGLSLESGEGDPTDSFAAEYRDRVDEDEDESEGESEWQQLALPMEA